MPKFRETDLRGATWTPIAGNWRRTGSLFIHTPEGVPTNSFNMYACSQKLRDGAVEATVRVFPGGDSSGRLLFRYDPRGCYYAGIGGYSRHFAIVKHVSTDYGQVSQGIAVRGQVADVRHGEPYDLRVEFIGTQITLKSSGVTVAEATDSWFQEGHIGVETWGRTGVEFSNFRAYEVPPIADVLRLLESFPYTLKRDYSYLRRELSDEADVQRILWTVLRSQFPDLVDEEVLGKFGLKHYRNDFGIPSLATIIEVKVVIDRTDLKSLQEDLMVDAVGYFSLGTVYRHLIYFIYNKANKLIDSAFVKALESLPPVAAVVIVPGFVFRQSGATDMPNINPA